MRTAEVLVNLNKNICRAKSIWIRSVLWRDEGLILLFHQSPYSNSITPTLISRSRENAQTQSTPLFLRCRDRLLPSKMFLDSFFYTLQNMKLKRHWASLVDTLKAKLPHALIDMDTLTLALPIASLSQPPHCIFFTCVQWSEVLSSSISCRRVGGRPWHLLLHTTV